MLTFGANSTGFNPCRLQWNSFQSYKILILNEDTLAIVKSEASQCLSAYKNKAEIEKL